MEFSVQQIHLQTKSVMIGQIFQIIHLIYKVIFHKIKPIMRKPQYYQTKSSENIIDQTTPSSTHQIQAFKVSNMERIDLRRFNEYLEDKISSKIYKKVVKNSRREQVQSDYLNSGNVQNQRELRYRPPSSNKIRQQLSAKQSNSNHENKANWKRHQSIQKLLLKEKKSIERPAKNEKNREQDCFQLMQRRYKQLQEKYKRLMQETVFSAKEFQKNQRQLFKLKIQHSQNQEALAKLQHEIMGISKSKSPLKNYNFQVDYEDKKSQPIIQSDGSLISNQLTQNTCNQRKKDSQQNFHLLAHKTSQSWTNKERGNQLNREQGYSRVRKINEEELGDKRDNNKYYSADKMNLTQTNSKMRQINGQTALYSSSKRAIKLDESLSNSKIKLDHKYEPQKTATPTATLHKKMLNYNQFSKYRFQPTVRLN